MTDRDPLNNRRSKESSSYDEGDFSTAEDQQNSRSKTSLSKLSVFENVLENAQSAFSSLTSLVTHRDKSGEATSSCRNARDEVPSEAGRHRSSGPLSDRSERVSAGRSVDRSDRMADRSERLSDRSERTYRADRSNRDGFHNQTKRIERTDRSGNADRVNRGDRAGRTSYADRANRASRFDSDSHDRSRRDSLRQASLQGRSFESSRQKGTNGARHASSANAPDRTLSDRTLSDRAPQRKRSGGSFRENYGRASDYARFSDNDIQEDHGISGRQRGNRSARASYRAYEDDYSFSAQNRTSRVRHSERNGRQTDYGNYSDYDDWRDDQYGYDRDYDDRYASRTSRRGRHSEPEVYVKSGGRRGLFSGGFGGGFSGGPFLSFGSGGYGSGFRGGHAAGGSILSSLPLPVFYALPVVMLILIIVLLVFIVSSVQSCTASDQGDQVEVQEVQPMSLSYQASVTGLDSVADSGTTIESFTLANEGQNYMPTLSDEGLNSIQTALTPFTENEYDIGFVLMDLQTGSGYAYNIDQEVYGASSFKGPVLLYGCQEALEPGILSINTVNDSASNAIIYSDNRSYYNMRALFEEYSEISLTNWLANMNIDSDVESDTSFPHYSARESAKLWMNAYLYFTSSESDPDIVSWAQDLFSQTEVSMVRAGVDPTFALITDGGDVYISQTTQDQSNNSDQNGNGSQDGEGAQDQSSDNNQGGGDQSGDQSSEDVSGQGSDSQDENGSQSDNSSDGGDQSNDDDQSNDQQNDQSSGLSAADMASSQSNIVVYDKAGWLNGETDDGLCDAGIVYDGDKAYLIQVMSGAPDGDGKREALARLIAALWGQRATLAPSQGYVLVDPAQAQSSDQGSSDQGQESPDQSN